jgi:mannose-1-phosphate guanylyltransferase/mannose-1-phosphate guanylyltransferase/mannose-6-phosphate isomerase
MEENSPIVPVILSGGAGSRLWPASRPERPKQLLALTGEHTMLQATIGRVSSSLFAPAIVVANARHADLIEEQLGAIGVELGALLLEPAGRSTAPAIALAAIAAGGGATPLLVMPSDHAVADVPAFHAAVDAALPFVRQGWLCTLGIEARTPETAYGWIKVDGAVGAGVHRVGRFVEKPARDVAEAMLASGDHVWNAGIFMFRADTFLAALAAHAPDILAAAEAAMGASTSSGKRLQPDSESFLASPSASIDYAVMEKAGKIAVVPVSMGWNDIGSWDALYEISAPDGDGNSISGNVAAIEARNCLVRGDDRTRVTLLGVEDLIVVASGDQVLVMPRGRSQEVRKVIEAMAAAEREAGGPGA